MLSVVLHYGWNLRAPKLQHSAEPIGKRIQGVQGYSTGMALQSLIRPGVASSWSRGVLQSRRRHRGLHFRASSVYRSNGPTLNAYSVAPKQQATSSRALPRHADATGSISRGGPSSWRSKVQASPEAPRSCHGDLVSLTRIGLVQPNPSLQRTRRRSSFGRAFGPPSLLPPPRR